MSENLLGAQGDQRGVFRGKRQSFIERVGVKRLAAAENCGEGLNGHADNVVFRLLRGEGGTGRLRVETKHQRTGISRAKAFGHDAGPQTAGGAVLGNLFEQVVMGIEEKRKLRRELIDAESGMECRLDV